MVQVVLVDRYVDPVDEHVGEVFYCYVTHRYYVDRDLVHCLEPEFGWHSLVELHRVWPVEVL